MDWLVLQITLKDKDARALRIVRIFFEDDGLGDTGHYLSYKNIICSQLIVAMS